MPGTLWLRGLLRLRRCCLASALAVTGCVSVRAIAQAPPTPVQPSEPTVAAESALPTPSASYAALQQAVEDVRSDMSNWSSTEQAAFAAAVKAALPECLRLQQAVHDGEEVFSLARLCSLAQQWPGTYSAARQYTQNATALHRTEGFGLLLQADLHLEESHHLQEHLQELRGAGPVSVAQDELFLYAIRSLQISRPDYAAAVALMRQPDLLQCMQGCSSDLPPGQAEAEAWQTLTVVREGGVAHLDDATAEIAAAAALRTQPLPALQAQQALLARRQFELLGKRLPAEVAVHRNCVAAAGPAAHKPPTPCERLYVVAPADAVTAPGLMQAVEDLNTRLAPGKAAYLLLSDCLAEPKLRAAHTLCRKAPLLQDLGGVTSPLLVLADPDDLVLWTGSGSTAWFGPGGAAESLLSRPLPGTP